MNTTQILMDLIKFNTVSENSNSALISYIKEFLTKLGFTHELLIYKDHNGVEKSNLISHRGEESANLAFLCHSDTVPLANEEQLQPYTDDGKLYGRGSSDMKGPIAAMLMAIQDTEREIPLTVIITSDEEVGCEGASYIVEHSKLIKKYTPKWGIATEPTEFKPVYAHKGIGRISVTAYGKAAHSSTTKGDSANFKLAPFLYYISQLKEKYNSDKSFQNTMFNPPTNTINMTISDFNCAMNVTAERSRCNICFRAMPEARTEDVIKEITDEAEKLGLKTSSHLYNALYTDPESSIVKLAEQVTGNTSETVAYLTDASTFSALFPSIILGPGSINQAHTVNEFITIDDLHRGYEIYRELISQSMVL